MTTVTPEPAPPSRPPGHSAWATYGQWWKRTPGSALYLLAVFVLAITSLTVLMTLLSTGGGLIILVVGPAAPRPRAAGRPGLRHRGPLAAAADRHARDPRAHVEP